MKNLLNQVGDWLVSKLDAFLVWSMPWKPGTVLEQDNRILVVMSLKAMPPVYKAANKYWPPTGRYLSSKQQALYFQATVLNGDGQITTFLVSDVEILNSSLDEALSHWKVVKNP